MRRNQRERQKKAESFFSPLIQVDGLIMSAWYAIYRSVASTTGSTVRFVFVAGDLMIGHKNNGSVIKRVGKPWTHSPPDASAAQSSSLKRSIWFGHISARLGWRENTFSGWWFQTFFIFHNNYMGCHPSHWLSYLSRWLKPPTSFWCWVIRPTFLIMIQHFLMAECEAFCFRKPLISPVTKSLRWLRSMRYPAAKTSLRPKLVKFMCHWQPIEYEDDNYQEVMALW